MVGENTVVWEGLILSAAGWKTKCLRDMLLSQDADLQTLALVSSKPAQIHAYK